MTSNHYSQAFLYLLTAIGGCARKEEKKNKVCSTSTHTFSHYFLWETRGKQKNDVIIGIQKSKV